MSLVEVVWWVGCFGCQSIVSLWARDRTLSASSEDSYAHRCCGTASSPERTSPSQSTDRTASTGGASPGDPPRTPSPNTPTRATSSPWKADFPPASTPTTPATASTRWTSPSPYCPPQGHRRHPDTIDPDAQANDDESEAPAHDRLRRSPVPSGPESRPHPARKTDSTLLTIILDGGRELTSSDTGARMLRTAARFRESSSGEVAPLGYSTLPNGRLAICEGLFSCNDGQARMSCRAWDRGRRARSRG